MRFQSPGNLPWQAYRRDTAATTEATSGCNVCRSLGLTILSALILWSPLAAATPIDWLTTAQFTSAPTVTGPAGGGVTGGGVAGGGTLEFLFLGSGGEVNNLDSLLEDLDYGFRVTDALFRYTASIGDQTLAENEESWVTLSLEWEARRGFKHPIGSATNRSQLDMSVAFTTDPSPFGSSVVVYDAIVDTRHGAESATSLAHHSVRPPLNELPLLEGDSVGLGGATNQQFLHATAGQDVLMQNFNLDFGVEKAGQVVEFRFPTSAESLTYIDHIPEPITLVLLGPGLLLMMTRGRRWLQPTK